MQNARGASRGVLTMAFGPDRYIRMAQGMARSVKLHNPREKIAIVTDRRRGGLDRLFDVVLPLDPRLGPGLAQKLNLDRYTPFDETLFIDSDFLVFRELREIWERFAGTGGFGLMGHHLPPGEAHYAIQDLSRFLSGTGTSRIVMTNTGMLYFDRSARAAKVFETVRALAQRGDALGVCRHPAGSFNDEPLFGCAVEMLGLPIVSSEDHSLFTLACFGTEGMQDVNVRAGRSRHLLQGEVREPVAIHFNVDSQQSDVYDRELLNLESTRLTRIAGLPKSAVRAIPPLYRLAQCMKERWRRRRVQIQPPASPSGKQ